MNPSDIHPTYRPQHSPPTLPPGYNFGTPNRSGIRDDVRYTGLVITFDQNTYWYDPEFRINREQITSTCYVWTGYSWQRVKLYR